MGLPEPYRQHSLKSRDCCFPTLRVTPVFPMLFSVYTPPKIRLEVEDTFYSHPSMSVIYEGSPLDHYLREASEIEEDVEPVMDLASEAGSKYEDKSEQEETQQVTKMRAVGYRLVGSIGNELRVGCSVLLEFALGGSPRTVLEVPSIEPTKTIGAYRDLAEMSKYILCSSSLMGSSLPRAVEHPVKEAESDREDDAGILNDPHPTSSPSLASPPYPSSPILLGSSLDQSKRIMIILILSVAITIWLAFGSGLLLRKVTMTTLGLLSGLYILGRSTVKNLPSSTSSSSGNSKTTIPVPRLLSSISQAQKDALLSLEKLVSEAEAYDRSMNAALGNIHELDRDLPTIDDVSTSSLPSLTFRQTLLSTLSTLTHLSSEASTNLMPFVSSTELGTLSNMYGLDIPPPLLPPTSPLTKSGTKHSDLDDPKSSPYLSSLRPFEITRLNTPTRPPRFSPYATSSADIFEPTEQYTIDRWESPPRTGSSRKRHSMLSLSGGEDEGQGEPEDTSHFTAMPRRTSRASKRQTWSFSGGVRPRMNTQFQNSPRNRLRTQTSSTVVLDMTPSKNKERVRSASSSPIAPTLAPSPLAATIIPADAQSPFLTRLTESSATDVSTGSATQTVPPYSPTSAGSRALNELTRSSSSASTSSREGSATSSTPYYLKRRSLQTMPYRSYSPSHESPSTTTTVNHNVGAHDLGFEDLSHRLELSASSSPPSMMSLRSREHKARMSPKRLGGGGTYTPRRGPMDQVQEEIIGRREPGYKNSMDLSQSKSRSTPLGFRSGHRHTLSSPSSLALYRPRMSRSECAEEGEERAREEKEEEDRVLVPLSHAHLLTHFFGLHANRRYTLVSLLALKKDLVDTSWEDIQTQVETLLRGFTTAREEIGKELRIHRQQRYWTEHRNDGAEGFAPRSKTRLEERRDWIEQLRREVDLLETNLAAKAEDEILPGGFGSTRTDEEWDSWWLGMRDELGGLIRIWERGRISMGIEAPNGLIDSSLENQSSSPLPDVAAPLGVTDADEPERILLPLGEARPEDTELVDDVALHLESQLRLPPPGREEVFIGDTAPVPHYRPSSKLSREERILLAKRERENSKQGLDGEEEISGMDDVVSELKGLMSELRRLKRPHEADSTDPTDDQTKIEPDALSTERASYSLSDQMSFSPSSPPMSRPSLPFDLPSSLAGRLSLPALSIGSSDGDDLESDDQDGSFELEFPNSEKNGSQVTITLGVDSDADTEEGNGSKAKPACSTP